MTDKKVKLILEDGSSYEGYSFGALANTSGEVVFNTGMVGYPESMTDPSYRGQILVLTYPLIGNYGVPAFSTYEVETPCTSQVEKLPRYFESDKIQVQGLIVSDYSENYSHWSAKKSLAEWMQEQGIPGIYGVDTRAITKRLREKGSMLGQITDHFHLRSARSLHFVSGSEEVDFEDPNKRNLVAEVSVKKPVIYYPSSVIPDRKSQRDASGRESSKILDSVSELHSVRNDKYKGKKVVLVDTGGKYGIIRSLLKRGVTVVRVPWDYDFMSSLRITPVVETSFTTGQANKYEYTNNTKIEIASLRQNQGKLPRNDKQEKELGFDGIILTNGPGDPKMCKQTIANVKKAMAKNIPILGICLGNQILALAAGANTYKLKYGHRSQNQPCIEVGTKRCYITSQNHGYAVNGKTLPKGWREWFTNANDGTNEGIRHQSKPFMSVQFHPEATPGPVDTNFLFDKFLEMI